jgi:Nucleotidyl transferase AbiEii toxin, Type IV TA system
MIVHGFVDRETRDIDLFTEVDDREAVSVAVALRAALERQGLATRDAMRPPHDHRFVVTDAVGGRECTVEVFADGGRLHPRVVLGIGPVLHPDDLAADKMLALWGRARPRDFLDVAALRGRYPAERLLELAAAKDSGFSVATFLDALRAIARLGPADWAEDGILQEAAARMRSEFDQWRSELEERRRREDRSSAEGPTTPD